MSYINSKFNEVFDFSALTLQLPMFNSHVYTRKLLIESEEQVLAFSQFIKAQLDQVEEKKALNCQETDLEERGADVELVIGVDCEGMSRQKNLALIQVGVANKCFLFDMTKLTVFPKVLKQILEDANIVKVFHDFCEDTSALVRQFQVHCDRVFDTQIAHRLLRKYSDDPKDQNLGLNMLLKHYLNVENNQKESMVNQMKSDPELWWKRPLSYEMQEYASQDVLYLPRVYEAMKSIIIQEEKKRVAQLRNNNQASILNSNNKVDVTLKSEEILTYSENQSSDQDNMSVSTHYSSSSLNSSQAERDNRTWVKFSEEIFEKTQLCQRYAYLNRNFPSQFILQQGAQIKAFVKNFQPFGVFCSLNLGVSGLIKDPEAIDFMTQKFQVGDIIDVVIEEEFDSHFDFENARPLVLLDLPQQKPVQFQSHFLSCLAANTEYIAKDMQFNNDPFRFSFNTENRFQLQHKQSCEGFFFGMDNSTSSNLLTTHKVEVQLPPSQFAQFKPHQSQVPNQSYPQYRQRKTGNFNQQHLSQPQNSDQSYALFNKQDKKSYYEKKNRVVKKYQKQEETSPQTYQSESSNQSQPEYEDKSYQGCNKIGSPPLKAQVPLYSDHSWRKKTGSW
eukprot:403372337